MHPSAAGAIARRGARSGPGGPCSAQTRARQRGALRGEGVRGEGAAPNRSLPTDSRSRGAGLCAFEALPPECSALGPGRVVGLSYAPHGV